jgi:hypothetical protein
MLRATLLLAAGCSGLLLAPGLKADPYYGYGRSSGPAVRVGVDVIFGGFGYARPAPPPVVWYPVPVYGYARGPAYYYGPPRGLGQRKHRHRHHDRWERCDD